MGSSWALVFSTAFVCVILSSASTDELIIEQRDISHDRILQVHDPDLMLQRPLDLTEILQGFEQQELTPRGRRVHFDPVAFGGPPEPYPVQFPLGRPTSDNLRAICLNGDLRPRYPKSYFPDSGFGSQVRRGSAVNKAETWFSICCKGNQTWAEKVTLCCLTRAWVQSIKSFCREEFSIKTSHYHCCRKSGTDRLNCFNDNAPNPNYEPTEEIPMPPLHSKAKFKFDPNICRRSLTKKNSLRSV